VNSNLVGLDVTCSGAQILGGLIKDEKMLLDTNLFVKKNLEQKNKRSIYTVVLELLLEKLEKKDFFYNDEIKFLILKKITRNFVKGWTMRFLYSESNYSRTQFLFNQLNTGPLNSFSILEKSEQYTMVYKISLTFVETFQEAYNEAYLFLEKLKTSFRNAKKVDRAPMYVIGNSTSQGEFKSIIDASKKITKQYRMYSFKEKEMIRSTYKYNSQYGKLDISSLTREVVPNFIHHLDSVVLYASILKLKKRNINVFVVHDCFYIDRQHVDLIQTIYYESFLEKILLKDCCKEFLKLNNIDDVDSAQKKINIAEYERSYFILTE